jgi:uncharacterized protein (DUF934 family)
MPKLIKGQQIIANEWTLVTEPQTTLPSGKIILSLENWNTFKDSLSNGQAGVILDAGQPPELIAEDLDKVALIAINFPAFADGRGYSYARLLRERYNFKGEIRAIGDVLQDQLFYMSRCGFDAYDIREDKDIEKALAGFATIGETYQTGVDQTAPLFMRR